MKFIYLFILLIGSITMSHAQNTMYYMQFKAHLIDCEARLNGMYLFNSLQQSRDIPILQTVGQPISEYMMNGHNLITLRATDISSILEPKDLSDGYCEITIFAYHFDAETGMRKDEKELSNIKIVYKDLLKEGNSQIVLSAEESKTLQNNETQPIIFINKLIGSSDELPEITYGQHINVAEAYPFQWIHQSSPLSDTQENKKVVWDKYMEIKQAIQNKDKAKIKQLAEPGLSDVANYQGDDVNNHFDIVFDQLLQDYFDFDPEVWQYQNMSMDDFNLEIYADGRLFRLVKKNAYIASPLRWKNIYTEYYRSYNPLFTLINGKIVMATF